MTKHYGQNRTGLIMSLREFPDSGPFGGTYGFSSYNDKRTSDVL